MVMLTPVRALVLRPTEGLSGRGEGLPVRKMNLDNKVMDKSLTLAGGLTSGESMKPNQDRNPE